MLRLQSEKRKLVGDLALEGLARALEAGDVEKLFEIAANVGSLGFEGVPPSNSPGRCAASPLARCYASLAALCRASQTPGQALLEFCFAASLRDFMPKPASRQALVGILLRMPPVSSIRDGMYFVVYSGAPALAGFCFQGGAPASPQSLRSPGPLLNFDIFLLNAVTGGK